MRMKTLLYIVSACLMAGAAVAAQCEGKTLKGERCKREAAEGSKFCIGHADQAKKAAPAKKADQATKADQVKKVVPKEKDDGTCWAVTEAGTRCKHKKDGDKDYCKQHAADIAPKKPVTQCRALTWDGKQCGRKPVEGKRYCKQHCGK